MLLEFLFLGVFNAGRSPSAGLGSVQPLPAEEGPTPRPGSARAAGRETLGGVGESPSFPRSRRDSADPSRPPGSRFHLHGAGRAVSEPLGQGWAREEWGTLSPSKVLPGSGSSGALFPPGRGDSEEFIPPRATTEPTNHPGIPATRPRDSPSAQNKGIPPSNAYSRPFGDSTRGFAPKTSLPPGFAAAPRHRGGKAGRI